MSIHSFYKKLTSFLTALSITCLAVDVMVLLYGVFSRYIVGAAPIWVDELSRYLMISSVMLISGIVLLNGEHMRLNILERKLNERVRTFIFLYQSLIVTLVLAFMSYVCFNYAVSIYNFKTIGLGISKSIPMFSLPIGFLSLFLFSLINLGSAIKGVVNRNIPTEDIL